MVQQVNSPVLAPAPVKPTAVPAQNNPASANPVKTQTQKAVPALGELNARAFMQRQQIGAALYDRSFTLGEGARTMKRQDAIQAYAEQVQIKQGGPTARDLKRLERMLNGADKQIARLQTNERGANLASVEAIDGRDMDIVQENLMNRINAGIKDGSLTQQEAESLIKRQQELNELETKLRATDGKLTAGEQKMVLDQLRKTADEINQARNNGTGVNLGTYDYAQSVTDRQNALAKQLDGHLKSGALTEDEAKQVLAEFEKVSELKAQAQASGRIDWREATQLSSAMNNAEALMYDLTRNKDGVQLAHSYVDVKYVDMREAQQLEGIVRGIDNGRLTNEEAGTLLRVQQGIQSLEEKLGKDGLTRSEYLRLQTEMNDFSLQLSDLYNNRDRYNGIIVNPPGGSVGAGGSTGAPANGGSASAGGSIGGAARDPAPTSPVQQPQATAPAPAAPPASAPAMEEKSDKPIVKLDPAPAPAFPTELPKLNVKLEEIKDRFAEFMTGMMSSRTNFISELHEKIANTARERREATERRGDHRDEVGGHRFGHSVKSGDVFGISVPGRQAEFDLKIASYASAAESAKPTVPPMTKKVA